MWYFSPYRSWRSAPAGEGAARRRSGNGHLFASSFVSEDEACAMPVANLEGEPLAAPRTLKCATGRRRKAWQRNCVAIGLSSGLMEPLESTSIRMIQSGIARLLQFFPDRSFQQRDIDQCNELLALEAERIGDFLILHYKASRRTDSAFWNACRTMDIPPTVAHKIALFQTHGRMVREPDAIFVEGNWLHVMAGHRLRPALLADTRAVIRKCVNAIPGHARFIAEYCMIDARAARGFRRNAALAL